MGGVKQNNEFLTIEREVNIMEAASNIPERDSEHIKGCLCSKSVRFGINGLQRGLDTHMQTHKHIRTQNPLPQLRLIRFTARASKALQCSISLLVTLHSRLSTAA